MVLTFRSPDHSAQGSLLSVVPLLYRGSWLWTAREHSSRARVLGVTAVPLLLSDYG